MSDDAWRGDEGGGFLGPWAKMFMDPSPEEIAKAVESRKRNIAGGNLRYETLTAYNPEARCVKCGENRAIVRHVPVGHAPSELGDHDGMRRTCRACRFTWYERTLEVDCG